MKSIIKQLTLSIGMIATLGACSKKLDIVPEGAPTTGNFWKTEKDAVSAANSLYEKFDDENFYGRGYWWFINASDDMVTGRIKAEGDNIKNFNRGFIGGSYTEGQWQLRYIVIKRANDIITKVPGITMNEALKKRILGEAYFFSGLMYFELAYTYGDARAGVPLVDRNNMSSDKPLPRSENVNKVYEYVEKELLQAVDLLPYFDQYQGPDYGRPHKTAAYAFLSKMFLYKKDYANAEKYADMVMQSGKHKLLDNFADVFTIANNWSSEYIWSAYGTASGPNGWGSILPGVMLDYKGWDLYNGWGYYMPTKELYDTYLPGDKRREATILKPGDKFVYFGKEKVFDKPQSLSGYQFRKYMEPFTYADGARLSKNGDHPTTDLNVPLLRYAEVILIKAEAKLMQGKNADAEINMIRRRAGLVEITGADMKELKLQRRCELAGEWANRHVDLVRWGDAKAAYGQPLHGADGKVVWPARDFDPAIHHVWPVPQSEIISSGGIVKQNAGW
ncbi:RagB/SusD family nutrient uptake outer membrane protein [Chitinophaga pendula]|uniref:RagB/SusD family nutrient uptake outer membrane protein n=1 Tax=Chitinophaga TaxID=79328 RepID=UPI000BB03371|nr:MULTISPECIES: RagB/SusD family nutrient uptake outer membrane protein [Chitinophaga]ASZ11567.1 RagB/SusD family nutrient uptake outer membrane protein [Chitinophaga sp. MD30]UCJ05423.1 RagB/SusD family nutrient uptake outer membrane protein [Chitinophaga pendula]